MPNQWDYLVSESQFATELVVTGLRQLCTVPTGSNWLYSHSQTYPLHVGLHAYTSGLERLCKLTIASHGIVTTGKSPSVKALSHKIGTLLDRVNEVDTSQIALIRHPSPRPTEPLDPALTKVLERFASGAGRYEHLDSLWNSNATVTTLDSWNELCERVSVPNRVLHLLSMRSAVFEAIRHLCTNNDFEASGFALLDPAESSFSMESSAVALHLYQKASWVASSLDAITYYTQRELPILGEAVERLLLPDIDFYQYFVTQIQDESITREELAGRRNLN